MDMANRSDTAEAETKAPADTSPPRSETPRAKSRIKRIASKRPIVQSTIGFPYSDLESAISVAQSILGAGSVALSADQLAGIMSLQAGRGNFMIRAATARMFGLITYVGGKYELTDLGLVILDKDDNRQRRAKAESFLGVPLYKRTYEEFKGKQLPPRPLAFEQAFVRFGVSPKQKDTARLVFDKSEIKLGDEYLMSSLFTASEMALARLGLAEHPHARRMTPVANKGAT